MVRKNSPSRAQIFDQKLCMCVPMMWLKNKFGGKVVLISVMGKIEREWDGGFDYTLRGRRKTTFDKAGLVGAFIGIGNWFCAVEERSVVLVVVSSDIGRVGVKGNSVFGKMVSKTKYGLFEVLIVSKWNSKSTIKEFACSLKQVMEMVVVPSLMIALK
ncbi:hypothetical protein Tco_0365975 [Tanacetum coccineum]